jgi:hypothetical protein
MANIVKRLGYAGTGSGSSSAANVVYDNDTSGLASNDVQGAIDELAASSSSKYNITFNNSTDWTLISGSYSLTVLKATHNRNNPTVQVFELVGSDYLQVETGVNVNSSEDVIITINSVPDLRFTGKILIS